MRLSIFFLFVFLIQGCTISPEQAKYMSTEELCYRYEFDKSSVIRNQLNMEPNISREDWENIDNDTIYIGMSETGLKCLMGRPYRINTSTGSYGTHKQWVYKVMAKDKGVYVYTENGSVVSWQY